MAGTDDIRWGILGPGWIAELFAEDLARTPGARLVAVASRDLDKARTFADKHGAPTAYGDYASLATDPNVDVVYIATPHSHHHAHAKMMLEGGKPVLVEKPFTMNALQAAEIFALARSRGLFVMDAMWTLINPLYRKLAERVAAGDIGTPRSFSAVISPMGGQRGHRVLDPALGGSYTLECMVYPVNILAGLAPGLLADARVTATAVLTELGVDSVVAMQLSNSQGHASMTGGFAIGAQGTGGPPRSGFHLIGDHGWLAVTDNLFNPGQALFSSRGNPVETLTEKASEDRYRWEIEEVGRCLRGDLGSSPIVTPDLTVGALRVMDQALIQVRGGILT